jgi:signal recognition particle subunit SRP54
MRAGEFSFDDFLTSYRMLRKMGPLKGVLSMIPGLGNQLKGLDVNEGELSRVEAIVLSMTPQERQMPDLIDGSRRKRIAAGSGRSMARITPGRCLPSARRRMRCSRSCGTR